MSRHGGHISPFGFIDGKEGKVCWRCLSLWFLSVWMDGQGNDWCKYL